MAEVDETQFSIMNLEEELTCSICLSPFDCPVTIPCGHNFCQDCLLDTWKDSYSCPQCRTLFATKPELKKNTVLTAVVETFKGRSSKREASLSGEESKLKKKDVIRCDACMEAEASQTCLICMASCCEKHLHPHQENPIFHLHQLSEPVGDLLERICPDHHKLEVFCSQHDQLICSFCLQQVHKGCSFMTPEEQRKEDYKLGSSQALFPPTIRTFQLLLQCRGSGGSFPILQQVSGWLTRMCKGEIHVQCLTTVFNSLAKANFTVCLAKCKFAKPKVAYLGSVVDQDEVQSLQVNVETADGYPHPAP